MFHTPAHKQTDAAKAPGQVINVTAAPAAARMEAAVAALREAIRNRDDKTFSDACSRIAVQFDIGIGSLRNVLADSNDRISGSGDDTYDSYARRYGGSRIG